MDTLLALDLLKFTKNGTELFSLLNSNKIYKITLYNYKILLREVHS